MVMRGNCTFYEKVRLAQLNGAKGLLIVSKDRLVRVNPYNSYQRQLDSYQPMSYHISLVVPDLCTLAISPAPSYLH